jgi:hypothetical protein
MAKKLALIFLIVTSALGEQFYLQWEGKDKVYGPFNFEEGSKIQIDKASFTLLRNKPANTNNTKSVKNSSDAEFESLMRSVRPPLTYLYGQNTFDRCQIEIHYGDNTYFFLENENNDANKEPKAVLDYPIEIGGKLALENKYFSSEGKTIEILKSTSDPLIAEFRNDKLQIRGSGDVVVYFDIGEKRVKIPLRIKSIPLKKGMDADKIVNAFGVPTKTTKKFVSWPDTEIIDEVWYHPSPPGQQVEHWHYSKYPGIIFSLGTSIYSSNNSLSECINVKWRKQELLRYRLENN